LQENASFCLATLYVIEQTAAQTQRDNNNVVSVVSRHIY